MAKKKPNSDANKPNQDSHNLNKTSENPAFADIGKNERTEQTSSPRASVASEAEQKKDSNFLRFLKKIAFSVWAVVMAIGMALAFLISLFLL